MDTMQKVEKSGNKDKVKKNKKGEQKQWTTGEDLDKLCAVFTTYLTSATNNVPIEAAEPDEI